MKPSLPDYPVRGAVWLFYFSRFFVRQFYRQNGLQIAASLSYATLLSLVPLVTVMFAFRGGFPGLDRLGDAMHSFVFSNFVPEFGGTVQEYLEDLSGKAARLTAGGLAILFVIALMLMATIDNALNRIWRVEKRRSAVARFLVYWAMLTLGPILIGSGIVATSNLLSLPMVTDVESSMGLRRQLLSALPFLTSTVALILLYVLVPNCHVMRRHAVIGAGVAAVLFELAKTGFGVYVRSVPAEAVYGAIAVIPLFLVWIYTSWVIVLLGAHITFCIAEFRLHDEREGGDERWTFEEAWLLIGVLREAQKQGRAISYRDLRAFGLRLPQQHVNEIAGYLLRANWIELTADGAWMLARNLDDVTVLDLHRAVPRRLPLDGVRDPANRRLQPLDRLLSEYRVDLQQRLQVPVGLLLEQVPPG